MTFSDNIYEFAGKAVRDFQQGSPLESPAEVIPRIRVDYDSDHGASDLLLEILQDPQAEYLTGIVIGMWSEQMYENPPTEIMETLINAAPQLPNLTALYLGEMTFEESEISWIQHCNISPLWSAFPKLEHFAVRGTNELSFGQMDLPYLKSLVIESGGLPKALLHEVINANLPELESLEIYLGTDHYGWDGAIADVEPLLNNNPFPKLTYLGLRNSDIQDEVARAPANATVLNQLEVLDLSLGIMSDEGAAALLASEAIRKLKKLDVHHNYLTPEMADKLIALPIKVDASDQQDGEDDDRYVSVGE